LTRNSELSAFDALAESIVDRELEGILPCGGAGLVLCLPGANSLLMGGSCPTGDHGIFQCKFHIKTPPHILALVEMFRQRTTGVFR
jgi:hypothetical protein